MDFVNNWNKKNLRKLVYYYHMNGVNENIFIFILHLRVFQYIVVWSFITLNEVAII